MADTITAVFLRHGHAMTAAESGVDSDAGRKLSARGKEEAARSADKLAAMKFRPDLILTSPLARAIETTAIIISRFNNFPEPVVLEELSCQPDPFSLINAISSGITAKNFPIIIGHQPSLGAVCGCISDSNPVDMHTGTLVIIKIDREKLKQGVKACGKVVDIYNP